MTFSELNYAVDWVGNVINFAKEAEIQDENGNKITDVPQDTTEEKKKKSEGKGGDKIKLTDRVKNFMKPGWEKIKEKGKAAKEFVGKHKLPVGLGAVAAAGLIGTGIMGAKSHKRGKLLDMYRSGRPMFGGRINWAPAGMRYGAGGIYYR